MAIEYLSKSLEAGYRSFYHIRHDINLADIRDIKVFSDLMSKFGVNGGAESKSELKSNSPKESRPVYVRYEIPYSVAFGVKKVKLLVNGLPAVAIFDPMCKNIEISEAQANYLYGNHFFKSKNILSKTFGSTGKIVNGDTIMLSEVSIGKLLLKEVSVKVVGRDRAPITIGGKFLCGDGNITVGSNMLVINRVQ